MNITTVKDLVLKTAGHTSFNIKKFSPEILVGVSIVCLAGAVFEGIRAGKKLDEVNFKVRGKIEGVREERHHCDLETYSDMEYKKDLAKAVGVGAVEYGKLFSSTIILSGVSIAAILGARGVLQNRNVALVAAYKLLEEAYGRYRARVVEDYGAEKDYMYAHGVRSQEVVETTVGEDGKKIKTKKTIYTADANLGGSPYAAFFGPEVRDEEGNIIQEKNHNYTGDPIQDAYFLKLKQDYANNKLRIDGHLVLNDVYEMLGMKHTRAGMVVGWVLGDLPGRSHQDGYVDFDLYNLLNDTGADFKRHSERGILLDFNVDGIIMDLI